MLFVCVILFSYVGCCFAYGSGLGQVRRSGTEVRLGSEVRFGGQVPAHGVAHRTDRTAVRRSGSEPDLFLENADPKLI